jgi:hypothetical protein
MSMRGDNTRRIPFMRALALVAAALLFCACSPEDNPVEPTGQGLFGVVEFWEGDFMPTYPGGEQGGTVTPVKRSIYIYEPTHFDDVTVSDPTEMVFFEDIRTRLVKIAHSDADGRFATTLPAGEYSVFVKEGDRFYINLSGGDGVLGPAEVVDGEFTFLKIAISYRATF